MVVINGKITALSDGYYNPKSGRLNCGVKLPWLMGYFYRFVFSVYITIYPTKLVHI